MTGWPTETLLLLLREPEGPREAAHARRAPPRDGRPWLAACGAARLTSHDVILPAARDGAGVECLACRRALRFP